MNHKDRHVAATAFAHGADLIVTNDRRLRREIKALDGHLLAVTGDEFALRLLVDQPVGVDVVIDSHPVTRIELIDQLAGSLPAVAAELRLRAQRI